MKSERQREEKERDKIYIIKTRGKGVCICVCVWGGGGVVTGNHRGVMGKKDLKTNMQSFVVSRCCFFFNQEFNP